MPPAKKNEVVTGGMLEQYNLNGFVEPQGFPISWERLKQDAEVRFGLVQV
ncbi:hypothetical protein [Marinobacterium sedimentorum]|nr:hypothetical protein [Marinobacterium sedimentorum]MCP8688817.1 hypothetical protein [Marinobacterium sedimentorum]